MLIARFCGYAAAKKTPGCSVNAQPGFLYSAIPDAIALTGEMPDKPTAGRPFPALKAS
jgi:hypothetical protein